MLLFVVFLWATPYILLKSHLLSSVAINPTLSFNPSYLSESCRYISLLIAGTSNKWIFLPEIAINLIIVLFPNVDPLER